MSTLKIWGWVGAGLLSLVLAGALYAWISPKPKPRVTTTERTTTKTEKREDAAEKRKLDERQKIIDELTTKLQNRRQADVNTRVVERIERYPSGSPAPIVVNAAGPGPAPTAVQPQPLEIIVRTTETVDRSRDETEADTSRRTDTDTARKEETDSRKVATEKTETDTRKETTVDPTGDTAKADPEERRFGAGVLSGQGGTGIAPFVSYDLVNKPIVKTKLLGLNKIRYGLGVFGTRSSEGEFDGGPQVNVGRGNVFGMAGYRVKQRDPVIGVGLKWSFR